MPMSSAVNKIVSLPLGFSTRHLKSDGPGKQIRRKSSTHTTRTEECSLGTTDTLTDLDISKTSQRETKFNESSRSLTSDSEDEGDDVAMEALDQLTELKTAAEANFDAHFDALTRKLAQLEEESRREEWKLRKMKRQARINKAREDYLECLEAMSSTDLQSQAPELMDDSFLKEKGLGWKEIEFDDL